MNKKPLKDPKGGLTPAGRKAFGGNLKPGVKNYSTASVSDKKRWISWALRFYGQDNYPPLKKPNGEPTRFALTAAAWGEPVPSTEAEARAIAAKARKRKQELTNQVLGHGDQDFTKGEPMSKQESNNDPFVEDFLEHFGVKGMKWGVRKATPTGATGKVNRQASKDAKEFARAKMFYGEGAGNRRKLIKAKVDEKSKRDPSYKKAFDYHTKNQDMSKHADKAVKERKSTDRKVRTKQQAGAVARRVTGEWGTQAAFVAVAAAGIGFARSPKGQALMKQGITKAKNYQQLRQSQKFVSDLLKNMR